MTNSDSSGGKCPVIRISNLVKRYGDLAAVNDLSLSIFRGEVLGFLGPNGAGKTTTINMICGLSQPTAGEIVFQEDKPKSRNESRTHIGFCPQENVYWPKLTCLEQLEFMGQMYGLTRRDAKDRAMELLEFLFLTEKSHALASKLSGGMKRRLNICLALIHDPEILILDEPEAGLDPQSRLLVRNFIKTLAKEKTIILTTHNMDEADRLADRIAIIDHGKLLLLDSPDKLKKSIGEGDILEIRIEQKEETGFDALRESLHGHCENITLRGNTLIFKSTNLIESVPDITGKIKELGYKILEITMRENTLEDVFIHLTGRKLRQ